MEIIGGIKFIADIGLLVLIWLVQLVIYPAFQFQDANSLSKWHPIYTKRISYVVMPLMLAQLGCTAYLAYMIFSPSLILQLFLVLSLWLLTFFQAVPLHQAIDANIDLKQTTAKLVRVNWPRTVLWTAIFIFSLFDHLRNL